MSRPLHHGTGAAQRLAQAAGGCAEGADARARDPEIYLTHITRVDGGIASIWQGDAAYDDLDTEKPGPRNRLLMLDSGWRLETSA